MSLRYEFEEDNRRDANSEKGKAYARQFLKRLNGPTKKRDPTDEELPGVLDFVEQVHMNIEWYWRKAERQHHMKRVFDRILVIVGVAAALWTAIASVIPNGPAVGAIGVVLAVAMAVLKLIPEANDFQKHRQHFWNAAANLKTELYTLESEALKGSLKVFDPPESYTLTNEFKLRLAQDLTKAREICQEEQTDFFALFPSTSDLINKTEALRNAVERAPRDAARPRVKRRLFEIDERRVEILPRIAVLEAIPKDASTAEQKQELEALKGEEKALEAEEKALKKLLE